MAILEARGLGAGYGPIPVTHDVDLHVDAGEVVAVLGANGAGKTTTLMALAGELKPSTGQILWEGEAVSEPMHRRAGRGLRFVTEERSVFMNLTTRENLRLGRGSIDVALELFPELERLLGRKAGLLSGGEQQMLAMGRALSCRPKVLLADELSLGLAPLIVRRLLEAVREAARHGVGVILVEQHIRAALEVADRAYVMRRGRMVLSGTATEMAARRGEIESTYLAAVTADGGEGNG